MATTVRSLRFALVLAVVMVPLAGCNGVGLFGSGIQETPIELIANNSANSTYTAEVFLVNASTELYFENSDGRSRAWEVGKSRFVYHPRAGGYLTKVELTAAHFIANLTAAPNQTVTRTVRNRPRKSSFLIISYNQKGHIVQIDNEHCDGWDLISVEVHYGSFGVVSDARCR